MDTVPEFYAEAPQATASEGLAQGPYVMGRMLLFSMFSLVLWNLECLLL